MRIESKQAFEEAVKAATAVNDKRTREIMVCCGTGCLANGSQAVADAFAQRIGDLGLDVKLSLHAKTTGCHGFCERGPLVVLKPEGILYTKVKPRDVDEILEKTVGNGEIIPRLLYRNPENRQPIEKYEEIPFYKHQVRVSMRNIGRIDPASLDDALAHGAYAGMARALFELTPEQVIAEVRESGLRGRGGAGFSTARKWDATRKAVGERKFVLCNGDEGDPGAFKDRSIMEGDPHAVIEGMVIGAYAIGAREGYVYVRDEYPLAVHHMNLAIEKAKERGLLGKNILGTGFDFDLKVSRGGGAFVCGESSALMRSIEGKIGEPRAKYIHASDKGLFDLPTALNNVETWSVVGQILNQGGAWFASMGTKKSKGTKSFSLVGKVKNTGLIELPMGTTL
ncbi:MAG TPA: NAD(P)H-dependent oxidoreductase subunit E, partial [Myxococcota bacterium]|nr:NAD(P)H-dependent oxidoreductase subunit E [Myxococcota bacterium]